MTEPARLARNAAKLLELHPVMRGRVAGIIDALSAEGCRPRIQQAWRSEAEQLEMVRRGTSKLTWGFHNTTTDGAPDALAVDLLDDDHPLVPPMRYLIALAIYAPAYKLRTGILWGLAPGPRERLAEAIARGNRNYVGARGWDPSHLECSDLTLGEARRGLRPAA